MSTSLGTWRNPPLAYVVAELGISPHYTLGTSIPALQDALRAAYPRTLEGFQLTIEGPKAPMAPMAPQQVWQLLSAEQGHGAYVSTRSISFHATSYVDFPDFMSRWQQVLEALEAAKISLYVERAGLRYIDLIIPSGTHDCSEYLATGLKGIGAPAGSTVADRLWASSFRFDGANVSARVGAPSPPGVILPPNFNAMPLQKPAVMIAAEKRVETKQPIGFIDTDCSQDVAKPFDMKPILDLFSSLHDKVSSTFKAVISPVATKEWV